LIKTSEAAKVGNFS